MNVKSTLSNIQREITPTVTASTLHDVAGRHPKRPLVERGAAGWRGLPMKPGLLWWMRFLQIVWCTLSLRTYADRNAMELKPVRLCLSLFTYRLALGIYMESAPAALRDALNWAQAKAFPLHSGWVDACDSPRCGLFGTYLLRVGLGNSIPSHPPPSLASSLSSLDCFVWMWYRFDHYSEIVG